MSEKESNLRETIEAAIEAQEAQVEDALIEHDISESVQEEPKSDNKAENNDNSKEEKTATEEDSVDIEPLQHWAKDEIDAYNELDDRAKKLYMKRYKAQQASYTKKTQAYAEERRLGENFKKVLAPYEEYLKSIGVDPFDAVDKLYSTEKLLRTGTPSQKAYAFQKLAQDYGINLNSANQPTQQEQQQYSPENIALLQKVQTLEQQHQVIAQDFQRRQIQSIANQIDNFQTAKDEQGQPKYPHFEQLRLDMSDKLLKEVAKTLEEAYDKSFWENEDLRQQYINMQYNSKMKEADTLKKTAASKKAGFNVKGSGGSSIAEPPDKLNTRQIIERAYAAQEKRARI